MIPAMTTGMTDFIISSGLITDIAAIPVPDLAVPQAAPRAERDHKSYSAIIETGVNNAAVSNQSHLGHDVN